MTGLQFELNQLKPDFLVTEDGVPIVDEGGRMIVPSSADWRNLNEGISQPHSVVHFQNRIYYANQDKIYFWKAEGR